MLALFAWCLPASLVARALLPADRWPRRFLAGVARIAGVRIARTGAPIPSRVLLLANHTSWIDICALAATANARFVAHDGLATVPFIRFLCRLNQTIFIARHHRAGIAGQIADLDAALADPRPLALFPEGTCGDGLALLPFKSALLGLDTRSIAIQPVALLYADAPSIAWVGDEPGLANFLGILGRRARIALTVAFLPPLAGAALTDRKTIAAAAQDAILITTLKGPSR